MRYFFQECSLEQTAIKKDVEKSDPLKHRAIFSPIQMSISDRQGDVWLLGQFPLKPTTAEALLVLWHGQKSGQLCAPFPTG